MSLQASVKFNIQIDSLGFLLKKKESLEKNPLIALNERKLRVVLLSRLLHTFNLSNQ